MDKPTRYTIYVFVIILNSNHIHLISKSPYFNFSINIRICNLVFVWFSERSFRDLRISYILLAEYMHFNPSFLVRMLKSHSDASMFTAEKNLEWSAKWYPSVVSNELIFFDCLGELKNILLYDERNGICRTYSVCFLYSCLLSYPWEKGKNFAIYLEN